MTSDEELFDALDVQIAALYESPAGARFIDTVGLLIEAAVEKAVSLGREHGPELVGRIVEGAAQAAISKALEK
jgi:hypothetical protein